MTEFFLISEVQYNVQQIEIKIDIQLEKETNKQIIKQKSKLNILIKQHNSFFKKQKN